MVRVKVSALPARIILTSDVPPNYTKPGITLPLHGVVLVSMPQTCSYVARDNVVEALRSLEYGMPALLHYTQVDCVIAA
eukprot:44886-Eustigmatos_ZCMA.PRE.2